MADCDRLNITFIYTHNFFFITHSLSHGQLFYSVLLEFFAPNKSKLLLPHKKKKKKVKTTFFFLRIKQVKTTYKYNIYLKNFIL